MSGTRALALRSSCDQRLESDARRDDALLVVLVRPGPGRRRAERVVAPLRSPFRWPPDLVYLSGLPCGLGTFWMLWDSEKQTWHDKLSSTVVVPASGWPPPPDSFGKPPAN